MTTIVKESSHKSEKTFRYFFKRFEYDLQLAFNEASDSKNIPTVKINSLLRRGSIYLKADYFIPMKSWETLKLDCDQLLHSLHEIKYILHAEVDSNFNLTICLRRPDVYKIVLDEVTKYGNKYGMLERNNSVLVLISSEEINNFIKMRNKFLAKHIISILSANNIKVYYAGSDLTNTELGGISVTCSENCCLNDICTNLREKLTISEWKKECETDGNLCINAKVYLEKNSSVEKYGKDIHSIVISDDDKYEILSKVAFIKHLLNEHIPEIPDIIIHVASHSVNRAVWKVGILLEIAENTAPVQSYIFNQTVKVSENLDASFDDYVAAHKRGIEKAMAHKYNVDISADKAWSSRMENLIDSVVKFDFLKLNPNMSLKLDLSNSQGTEKSAGIFVQYNFARLSNLFRKFELKVQENYYQPLNALEDVDFGLLRLEEEWNLFQYVVSFPKLVERILVSLTSESSLKTRHPINGICTMLMELCHYLSLYYSKIRILAGPQKHLQKLMNARLWLLKGVYQVLLNSFILLDIKGLDQM